MSNEDGHDQIFKIHHFIDLLNTQFNKIPLVSENYCIDEMMIPYSGKFGPKLYVKGKPCHWGYKA